MQFHDDLGAHWETVTLEMLMPQVQEGTPVEPEPKHLVNMFLKTKFLHFVEVGDGDRHLLLTRRGVTTVSTLIQHLR